jgi:hypothetical protein
MENADAWLENNSIGLIGPCPDTPYAETIVFNLVFVMTT